MVVYFDRVIFGVTAMMQYTIHVMSYEYIPPGIIPMICLTPTKLVIQFIYASDDVSWLD